MSFFREEFNKINVPIKVSKEVLKGLLLYKCYWNVGQFKNDIQLICANAFLDYVTGSEDGVNINLYNISNKVKDGFLNIDDKRDNVVQNFDLNDSGYVIFDENNSGFNTNSLILYDDYKIKENFYDTILNNIERFYENGLSTGQIKDNVNRQIKIILIVS